MTPQAARKLNARDRLNKEQLLVRDMMTLSPFTVSRDDTLGDVEALMQRKGIRHVPVVDRTQKLVGLISHRDLLRFSVSELSEVSQVDRNIMHSDIPVGELMQSDLQTVTPDTTLKTAAIVMAEKRYGCLPVTEQGKLVGIVTEGDFLRFFADGI